MKDYHKLSTHVLRAISETLMLTRMETLRIGETYDPFVEIPKLTRNEAFSLYLRRKGIDNIEMLAQMSASEIKAWIKSERLLAWDEAAFAEIEAACSDD